MGTTDKGIEGTLVHEGRHAQHDGRAISNFSMGIDSFNPNGFQGEYGSHYAYADYVVDISKKNHPDKTAFISEGLSLGVISSTKSGYKTSDEGIRKRIFETYNGLSEQNPGTTFGKNWNLKPATKK